MICTGILVDWSLSLFSLSFEIIELFPSRFGMLDMSISLGGEGGEEGGEEGGRALPPPRSFPETGSEQVWNNSLIHT